MIEGKVTLPFTQPQKISKDLETFYNPAMQDNRTITLEILKWLAPTKQRKLNIALPLAGSGIRAARILKETNVTQHIYMNDMSKRATQTIQKVLTTNKCPKKYTLCQQEANAFLTSLPNMDYIDIDPFGSPNPFLDAAVKKITHKGVIAITATDTAALCGTYPRAAKRKYNATQHRHHFMHETGLRILIKKMQEVSAQYDKAALPILSYATLHYMRVYFLIVDSRSQSEQTLHQHHYIVLTPDASWKVLSLEKLTPTMHKDTVLGPVWSGPLHNKTVLKHISHPLVDKLQQELDVVGFYHIPLIAKQLKKNLLPLEVYKKALKGSLTHIDPQALKTTYTHKTVMKKIKELY